LLSAAHAEARTAWIRRETHNIQMKTKKARR
jgi:hypothetical protein